MLVCLPAGWCPHSASTTPNLRPPTCTLPQCSTTVSTISPADPAPKPQRHQFSFFGDHSSSWSPPVCHSSHHSDLYPGTQCDSNPVFHSIPAFRVPAGQFPALPWIPL